MASQKDKRQRVSDLLWVQIDPKSIPNLVGVSLRTVYNVKKPIDMDNGIHMKLGNRGVNKKLNRDFIDALKTKIAKDPTTSICKIDAELKLDPKTVRTAVHDDFGLKSYPRMPRHLLIKCMKARRLERCKKVLRYIKNHGFTVQISLMRKCSQWTLFSTAETTGTSQSQ